MQCIELCFRLKQLLFHNSKVHFGHGMWFIFVVNNCFIPLHLHVYVVKKLLYAFTLMCVSIAVVYVYENKTVIVIGFRFCLYVNLYFQKIKRA